MTELASNGIRHGTPIRTLSIWQQAGTVICEARNGGAMADTLVGHRRPDPHRLGGRGLWIMRQLCDLVQIRSSKAETLVRVTLS